ncbi:MAG: universal stress protein E [Verrucomicrobiales bacterium]|jgi:universal stress protein E
MKNLKNIVVGIDYETPSDNALREAARIAGWDQATLTPVHVLDEEVLRDLQRGIEIDLATIIQFGEARLEDRVRKVLGENPPVIPRFLIGHPFQEIARLNAALPGDLVVLGSHGASGDDTRRLGFLADRCVRKLKQNVLIVRAHQSQPFRKITVCIDFSPNSKKAAVQAIHIAQQDNADLEFLHVRTKVSEIAAAPDFYTGTPATLLPNFDADHAKEVKKQLDGFAARLMVDVSGVHHSTRVEQHPKPRKAIIEHVNASGTDLVVLGTRGHSTLVNLLLGSTAEKIIHQSLCSTLVVKPEGFDYQLD